MRCYLFDIDGTLANAGHRMHHIRKQPKDWDAFFKACVDDAPFPHIVGLAVDLSLLTPLVFVSGRSDIVKQETIDWLLRHDLSGPLYMRAAGDRRPDDIVKGEILDRVLADGWEPIMVFDDRNRVVAMWRMRGIPCAQVAEGDF